MKKTGVIMGFAGFFTAFAAAGTDDTVSFAVKLALALAALLLMGAGGLLTSIRLSKRTRRAAKHAREASSARHVREPEFC